MPLPSSPCRLEPQQEMRPPELATAQLWSSPALTSVASVMPSTGVGVSKTSVVPVPPWPRLFLPQQDTAPVA